MAYVRVTAGVPEAVGRQVSELAKAFGWQLADLQRTLICIGATLFLLSYGNEVSKEAVATLMGGVKPVGLSRSFSLRPRAHRRPYAYRYGFRSSTLITLSLPESFRDIMAIYADLKRVSRNQLYSKCLQQGLLVYLKAQENTLASREKGAMREMTA